MWRISAWSTMSRTTAGWESVDLVDPDLRLVVAGLLPHEYVHSWNGKYRRPADLTTPDFEKPMRTDLLWVYEGLTSYLGDVLSARSGIRTPRGVSRGVGENCCRYGPSFRTQLAKSAGHLRCRAANSILGVERLDVLAPGS